MREDAGYPPLVTPTSQIVGTQAVFNVIIGERYKMFTKEFKGLVPGEYGRTPVPIGPEFHKKIIGDEAPITCRPADLLEPELEKLKAEAAKYAIQEEDVLTYAMFPQVAPKFFEKRCREGRRRGRRPCGLRFQEPSRMIFCAHIPLFRRNRGIFLCRPAHAEKRGSGRVRTRKWKQNLEKASQRE